MKAIRKIKIIILCFIILLSYACSNNNDQEEPKIKSEKSTRYFYKMGVPDEKGDTLEIIKYNEFGKPTEEITTTSKAIYKYENDTLLVSFTKYGKDGGKIWYKKNISYNSNGKKDMINIYETFASTKTPELVAGMKFIYDSNNKISEKIFFGAIDYNEVEEMETISSGPNSDDMEERERKRRADSTSAKYIRNKKGNIEMIYFNNDTSSNVKYTYNSSDQLLSKLHQKKRDTSMIGRLMDEFRHSDAQKKGWTSPNVEGKYYFYTNNKLSKTKEITLGGYVIIKTLNSNGKVIEVEQFMEMNQLMWKMKYNYTEDGLLKEAIKYNEIDEPETLDKYEYEFY